MKPAHVVWLAMFLLTWQDAAAQRYGFEARVGGLGALSRRSADFGGTSVATETGVMGGFAGFARYQFVGVSARVWGGRFGAATSTSTASGKIATGDVALLLGLPAVSALVGYGRRGYTGALGTITWSYVSVGGRAEVRVGSTGLFAGASLVGYGKVRERGGSGWGSGTIGETSLTYMPRGAPVFVTFGYSSERFTTHNASGPVHEEVKGAFLDAGLRFGAR